MKKSSRNPIIEVSRSFLVAFAVCAIVVVTTTTARAAEVDPNQLLAFKKIKIEPIVDNVDGVFGAPVKQSYKDVFDRNPRFEIVDDVASADSIIKTTVTKKAGGIDVEISLVVAKGSEEIFSTDKMTIEAGTSGQVTGETVKKLLKTALKRIPFSGTVTGRDDKELTFDIGAAHGIRKGDLLQISRISSVKRHPLLKTIVDAQLVPVGTAAVDAVEDSIAFGRIHEEIAGEKIGKLHKVTAIEGRLPVVNEPVRPTRASDLDEATRVVGDGPELGWVGLGVVLGGFSSSSATGSGRSSFAGSAFAPGAKLAGELWITKRWFGDMSIGLTSFSYSQFDELSTIRPDKNGASSSTRSFDFNFGYRYLHDDTLRGPQAYFKLGYHSFVWDVPAVASDLQSSKNYTGLNLGMGGSMPFLEDETGATLGFNLLLFPSLDEGGFKTGSDGGAAGASFFVGVYHFFSPRIAARAGVQFEIYSSDFDDGAASTSQRQVGFLPSLLYYF